MILIPAVLIAVALVKLISIVNAIRWLGGDAKAWRREVSARNPQTILATEMYAYAGIFLTAGAVMATVAYFISVTLGGFSDLGGPLGGAGLVDVRRLFDAVYATVNITGGSAEATPTTVLAKVISMTGTITYVMLTVVVLAGLAGIAITGPDKDPAP